MNPLRLSDCGETLTPDELCRVLQISRRTYQRWLAHHCLPVQPIAELSVTRFSRDAVDLLLHKLSCVVPMRRRA